MTLSLTQTLTLTLDDCAHVLEKSGLTIDLDLKGRGASGISAITTDSRDAQENGIFIAYHGVDADGHTFIHAASKKAISAVILEDREAAPPDTPWIHVRNGRGAWSILEAAAHGNPQTQLRFFAVTGTNGKTSTVWMMRELLRSQGVKTLTLMTLGNYLGEDYFETKHTTPDPDVFYALLRQAVDRGIDTVLMEASSHAISQRKIEGVHYEGIAFTSFSQDHLDFHGTMGAYLNTKLDLLRDHCDENTIALVNESVLPQISDPDRVGIASPLLPYDGSEVVGEIPYLGSFNRENFAAALALSKKRLGFEVSTSEWMKLHGVPGRFNLFAKEGFPKIIVDFAHTPDALDKTLRECKSLGEKLFVVFGCGGDRDRGKRPLMGAIAEELCDHIYIADDNPRFEDPDAIIEEIKEGISDLDRVTVERDRRVAIGMAVQRAKASDIVVVAGKGHETGQVVHDVTHPYDERAVVREILKGPR